MATTLTLKSNRRSLNGEVIVRLESVMIACQVTVGERLARARALRAGLPKVKFANEEIDDFKREGRR